MVTLPAIYTDNEALVGSDLTPPQRRLPNWLNWIAAILYPQQWLSNLFNMWYTGSNSPAWVSGTTYAYGYSVVDIDYCVYQCINVSGITSASPPHLDSVNWIVVLDNFVGVGERMMYSAQLAVLEYLLNYQYSVGAVSLPWTRASQTTQIYITNNVSTNSALFLTNASSLPLTGYLVNNSGNASQFMHNGSSSLNSNFTIHVPSAVASAITANQPTGVTYANVITALVSKYAQANYTFNIVKY